jgi:predicted transcriptional regulator
MERETYLKKVFKGKDEFCKALKALHAEYVRIAMSKGGKKQTLSAASILEEPGGADERNRIYREIRRLEKGGMTAKKAISAMMRGTYAARMKGVKPETWRRYYNDWKRHSAARKTEPIKSLSEPINEPIKVESEPINPQGEPINEPINEQSEPINALSEPINEPIKTEIQDCVFALIADNPGINRPEIIKHLKKCRSTVSRALVKLCASGRIEHRGSNKTGGYYATVPEYAADCRKQLDEQRDGTKMRKLDTALKFNAVIPRKTCKFRTLSLSAQK